MPPAVSKTPEQNIEVKTEPVENSSRNNFRHSVSAAILHDDLKYLVDGAVPGSINKSKKWHEHFEVVLFLF